MAGILPEEVGHRLPRYTAPHADVEDDGQRSASPTRMPVRVERRQDARRAFVAARVGPGRPADWEGGVQLLPELVHVLNGRGKLASGVLVGLGVAEDEGRNRR